ncbi:MAG: hypothetical protein ABWZ91_10390 [Nocardioides sp.]
MTEKSNKWKSMLAGLMAGLLVGGAVAVTAPSIAGSAAKVSTQTKAKAGGGSYTKAESNKRYYTKKKSDKKYQPKAKVIRGAISLGSAPSGGYALVPIHWGISLKTAPTAHIVPNGGPVPAGCSGTAASPNASPGHLCIFEQATSGYNGRFVCSAVNSCGGAVSPFGAYYGATTTSDSSFMYGSWALGVAKFSTARIVASGGSGVPGGPPGGE